MRRTKLYDPTGIPIYLKKNFAIFDKNSGERADHLNVTFLGLELLEGKEGRTTSNVPSRITGLLGTYPKSGLPWGHNLLAIAAASDCGYPKVIALDAILLLTASPMTAPLPYPDKLPGCRLAFHRVSLGNSNNCRA
jgi:hypothetical protein